MTSGDGSIAQLYSPPAAGTSGTITLSGTDQTIVVPSEKMILLTAYNGDAFYCVGATAVTAANQSILPGGNSIAFRAPKEGFTVYAIQGPATGGTLYYSMI
jgi:hypothetical protein